MFSAPFVSSHRPYTPLAAASTEHREFNVVVIPAFTVQQLHVLVIKLNHRRITRYAVLQAMTRVYGKTKNSTPIKYKLVKDIPLPPIQPAVGIHGAL